MKVSIISHGAHGGRGGIDQYIGNLIDALICQRKIKSINLFTKKYVKLNNNKIKKFYSNNSINFLMIVILNIINIFKSKIIIISHINLIPYLIIPILLNKKVILLTYGLEIWGVKKNFIYKFIIKKINFFICMRDFTMKNLKKKYNLRNKKIFLLPNCIKIKNFKILNKKKNKNVITVARLDSKEKYKGVDETLEAIALLKKINFYYFVVGDGSDKERLIKKAINLKIINNVKFFGNISNIQRSKLFLNSSIISMPGSDKTFDTYPFRFAFLEAAEFGLKIIGSYPPKGPEKNCEKNYININFVDPKNKKQILSKIIQLQKQKRQIDKKYLNDYSFDSFKNKLKNILSKIY